MNGTPVYGERVVIVQVEKGNVQLKTGHISSTDSSHVHADNFNKTVVWSDRPHCAGGNPDEAHEKSFLVNDIHLLKAQEAQSLQDAGTVQNWFGDIYQDWLVKKIHRALQRLKVK